MKLRHGSAEEAGIRPEVTALIRRNAASWVREGKAPALVLLAARKGTIFFHEAFGRLGPEEDAAALTKEAIFPLASLSKPITATALMILVEEGKVGLNRAVQEYIPEFVGEGKEAVMVHQLLTHSSGITNEPWQEAIERGADHDELPPLKETMNPRVNELLSLLYPTPLAKQPGQEMAYADANYYLAGEIVRRVGQKSLESFARQRIFGPLGMDDTYFEVPAAAQSRVVRRSEDAPGYAYQDKEFMERPSPSAGAYSTALDMASFGQMFLNGGSYGARRVLSPAAVAAMTRNQIPGLSASFLETIFPEAGWGLGWSINLPYKGIVYGEPLSAPGCFNHGGFGGVEMWVDTVNEIVGVYFSVTLELDADDFPLYEADRFMNMVTSAVTEPVAVFPIDASKGRSTGPEKLSTAGTVQSKRSGRAEQVELRPGTAEEAGVDPTRVKKVKELARGWVDSGMHPSLHVIAARHGLVFLDETLGRMGPQESDPPLASDALFPLASLSKPFTAAAAMTLVEEGFIGLNRPVQEYLPDFQGEGKERITIRHLMTHTSGLRQENLLQLAMQRGIIADSEASETNWLSLLNLPYPEYFDLLYELAPAILPDKKMFYADLNYDLLGDVIVHVTGKDLDDSIQERLLNPLELHNTYLSSPQGAANRVVQRPESAFNFEILRKIGRFPSGGISFFSSAMDMATFGQMFLNQGSYAGERILSPASVAAMTRDHLPGIKGFFGDESFGAAEWGLGWSVHHTKKSWAYDELLLSPGAFCHGGSGGVFMWVDSEQDLVAVFNSVYLSRRSDRQPDSAADLFINSVLASVVEN